MRNFVDILRYFSNFFFLVIQSGRDKGSRVFHLEFLNEFFFNFFFIKFSISLSYTIFKCFFFVIFKCLEYHLLFLVLDRNI